MRLVDLRRRDVGLRERMDDLSCDEQELHNTYAHFPLVNALVACWQRVYHDELRPHLRAGEARSLLDIGCGGGDLAVRLARWAAHDGLRLHVTGVDTDSRAIAYARARSSAFGVQYRCLSSAELLQEGQRFDFVISNHLLHHLDDFELGGLLQDSAQLARLKVLHNDIERHPLAYLGFGLLSWPFFRASFIRADGLTSIRRSYTRAELSRLAPPGWQARRLFPFRNLLVYVRQD